MLKSIAMRVSFGIATMLALAGCSREKHATPQSDEKASEAYHQRMKEMNRLVIEQESKNDRK